MSAHCGHQLLGIDEALLHIGFTATRANFLRCEVTESGHGQGRKNAQNPAFLFQRRQASSPVDEGVWKTAFRDRHDPWAGRCLATPRTARRRLNPAGNCREHGDRAAHPCCSCRTARGACAPDAKTLSGRPPKTRANVDSKRTEITVPNSRHLRIHLPGAFQLH